MIYAGHCGVLLELVNTFCRFPNEDEETTEAKKYNQGSFEIIFFHFVNVTSAKFKPQTTIIG